MEQYLFVIDYQNDFVDGALGFPGAEQLDEGLRRKSGAMPPGHVIFTQDTHQENYLETWEGKLLPVKHCVQEATAGLCTGKTAQALADCGAKGIDKPAFGIDCGDPTVLAVLPGAGRPD